MDDNIDSITSGPITAVLQLIVNFNSINELSQTAASKSELF